jgi:hypothetical protein
MGLFKKNNILLVGEIHGMPICEEFKNELVKKASYREIVLGLEGCPREDSLEQRMCKDAYDLEDRGHIYGYETNAVFTYSKLLSDYLVFLSKHDEIPPFFAPMVMMQRINIEANFIGQLCMNELLRKHWTGIEDELKDEESRELYGHITDHVFNQSYDNLIEHSVGFTKDNYKTSDDAWRRIIQKMIWSFGDEMPDYMNKHELNEIHKFLIRPRDQKRQMFAGLYMNIHWRGKYMYKNMRDIAKIAKSEDKDAYFVMGVMHLDDISRRFGRWAMGFKKRVYPHPMFVEPMYMP